MENTKILYFLNRLNTKWSLFYDVWFGGLFIYGYYFYFYFSYSFPRM